MTTQTPAFLDPLVDEVRQRRRELFADYGNDLRRLFDELERRQREHPEMLTSLPGRFHPVLAPDLRSAS